MKLKKNKTAANSGFSLSAGMIFLSVIILVFGLFFITKNSSSNSVTSLSSGHISILENNKDLGNVSMAKGSVDLEYEIVNDSDNPVTINKIDTSCMCTKAKLVENNKELTGWAGMSGMGPGSLGPITSKKTLQPGEKMTVLAEFDPNAHGPNATGPIRRTVSLYTNSETNPTLNLNFSGNVVKK